MDRRRLDHRRAILAQGLASSGIPPAPETALMERPPTGPDPGAIAACYQRSAMHKNAPLQSPAPVSFWSLVKRAAAAAVARHGGESPARTQRIGRRNGRLDVRSSTGTIDLVVPGAGLPASVSLGRVRRATSGVACSDHEIRTAPTSLRTSSPRLSRLPHRRW